MPTKRGFAMLAENSMLFCDPSSAVMVTSSALPRLFVRPRENSREPACNCFFLLHMPASSDVMSVVCARPYALPIYSIKPFSLQENVGKQYSVAAPL